MNPDVDAYLARSTLWPAEIAALRPLLLATGLDERLKWGKPCYCDGTGNIAIVQEMTSFLALMFFNGAVLADPDGVLERQGPNSRSARRITFRSVHDVERLAPTVAAYVAEAVTAERAGLRVEPATHELCVELAERLASDAGLAEAFDGLTPGRRREYDIFVSGAKRPATREARIDRITPRILEGKGLRDR
jgi:uncharacterized protein YdeI (YjbR/CyaY-like superfamily)